MLILMLILALPLTVALTVMLMPMVVKHLEMVLILGVLQRLPYPCRSFKRITWATGYIISGVLPLAMFGAIPASITNTLPFPASGLTHMLPMNTILSAYVG